MFLGHFGLALAAKRVAPRPSLGTTVMAAQWADGIWPIFVLLGVGPQGLGGDATAFAVHVELAATHITMNPVAVNMQCHSARRASAAISSAGVSYGF